MPTMFVEHPFSTTEFRLGGWFSENVFRLAHSNLPFDWDWSGERREKLKKIAETPPPNPGNEGGNKGPGQMAGAIDRG